MTAEAVYLDTSGFAKLLFQEKETMALQEFLAARREQVSSTLLRVEAGRILLRAPASQRPRASTSMEAALARLSLLAITGTIVARAAVLDPPELRSLDAIHLASALAHPGRTEFLTYDRRLAAAARRAGLSVCSPGACV